MDEFVSTFTNRLDAKGRVSIPAPFRSVLAVDGFDGIYCCPTLDRQAIDDLVAQGLTVAVIDTRLALQRLQGFNQDCLYLPGPLEWISHSVQQQLGFRPVEKVEQIEESALGGDEPGEIRIRRGSTQ